MFYFCAQCEPIEPKMARRNSLIQHGAVSTLVQLLSYTPRLPEPSMVCVCVCVHVRLHVHVCACACVYARVCIHVRVYACVCKLSFKLGAIVRRRSSLYNMSAASFCLLHFTITCSNFLFQVNAHPQSQLQRRPFVFTLILLSHVT
jgi:hypothetical protein